MDDWNGELESPKANVVNNYCKNDDVLINVLKRIVQIDPYRTSSKAEAGLQNCENKLRTQYLDKIF